MSRPTISTDCEALLAEAELAYAAHDLTRCRDAARQAWQAWQAQAADDPAALDAAAATLQPRAGFLLAHSLYRLGEFPALLALADTVVALLVERGQLEAACQVLRWLALGASEVGRFGQGVRAAQRGLRLAEPAELVAVRVLLSNALAACFERMGDPWQAERLLLDALAQATEHCGDTERFVTLNNLSAVALTSYYLLRDGGDVAEAQAALQRALAYARDGQLLAVRIGDPFYRVYIESNLGEALNFLGEHDEAQSWLDAALQRARAQRFETQVWRVQCSLGELAVERGRWAEGRDILQPLLATMGRQAPQVTALRAHGALYRALRGLGDTAGALDHLERTHRAERQRSVAQLKGQAEHLVTRLEVEQARRDALAQQARALAAEQVALRDALTGLVNRRGFEQHLQALVQAGGPAQPLVVAMADLDHFKSVNDRYGHAAGDAVLVQFAQHLREHVRPQDLLVRLGGEEFLIVWSDLDVPRAVEVAQRLRQAVAAHAWAGLDATLRVTVSLGVALLPAPLPKLPLGELLAEADRALYQAKRQGRDQVVLAGEP